jgi:hypothetical protein
MLIVGRLLVDAEDLGMTPGTCSGLAALCDAFASGQGVRGAPLPVTRPNAMVVR